MILEDVLFEIDKIDEQGDVITREAVDDMIEKTDLSKVPITLNLCGCRSCSSKVEKIWIEDTKVMIRLDLQITPFIEGNAQDKRVIIVDDESTQTVINKFNLERIIMMDVEYKLGYADK